MKKVFAIVMMACAAPSLANGAADTDSPVHPALIKGASTLWKGMSGIVSSITNPKSTKLAEMLKKEDFDEAAKYYEEEVEYFQSRKREDGELFAVLAAGLNKQLVPELTRHSKLFSSVSPSTAAIQEWPALRDTASQLDDVLGKYNKYKILNESAYRDGAVDLIAKQQSVLTEAWLSDAPVAFVRFDHGSGSFFKAYPVEVQTSLLSQAFASNSPFIASADADKLALLLRTYRADMTPDVRQRLETLYLERAAKTRGLDPYDYFGRVRIAQEAAKAGFLGDVPSAIGAPAVALIPNTATAKIAVMTSERKKLSSIKPADVENQVASNKYFVVLHAVSADVERRVVSKKSEPSSRQVGTRRMPNPDYATAQTEYLEAQRRYADQRLQNAATATYGAWGALAKGLSEGAANALVGQARSKLASTSPTVEEPVLEDYQYNVSQVESKRVTDVAVLVFDEDRKMVARTVFRYPENKSYRLAYGVDKRDTRFASIKAESDTEDAIERFENGELEVRLDEVYGRLLAQPPKFEKYRERLALFSSSAQPAKKQAARAQANIDDPRFESVVVVKNPSGGTGSGFFVEPNLVLTNYHVIEGSSMAEIRLRSGVEGVGKVVRTDPGLDLALIRVSDRGVPVQFTAEEITAGKAVDAIGHPSGLEFTLTRGIVSAVRTMANPLVKGSRQMKVVQTDAAISPGNSGGPLFMGNKVVGVNSQKLVRRGVEGIGFAVHHEEVAKFLAEP